MPQITTELRNTISPEKEMLAYEVLWLAVNEKNIKESDLKQLFAKYTPLEVLEKFFNEEENQEDFQIKPSLSDINYSLPLHSFQTDQKESEIKNNQLKESIKEKRKTVNQFLEELPDKYGIDFSLVVNKNFQYPESLKIHCPIGLFYYKGDLGLMETKCISVVGTRTPSHLGKITAKKMAQQLSDEGFTIVSGLARGIDAIAHKSAVESKGYTIGVIGTPLNSYYPKENKSLQDKIAEDHLLISQVPFCAYNKESFRLHSYHFPRRTKVMASISEATLIVEASDTKGSLIQARECLKQNKKLFIMESCFNNVKIDWPQKYEKKGAIKVKNASDILKYFE